MRTRLTISSTTRLCPTPNTLMIKVSKLLIIGFVESKRYLIKMRECDLTKMTLNRTLVGDPETHDTIHIEKQYEEERGDASPNTWAK